MSLDPPQSDLTKRCQPIDRRQRRFPLRTIPCRLHWRALVRRAPCRFPTLQAGRYRAVHLAVVTALAERAVCLGGRPVAAI